MEREIKFRGKRKDNGEWVYGYLVIAPNGDHRIYLKPFDEATNMTYYFVIPETVGQFVHGNLYEGDIISNTETCRARIFMYLAKRREN